MKHIYIDLKSFLDQGADFKPDAQCEEIDCNVKEIVDQWDERDLHVARRTTLLMYLFLKQAMMTNRSTNDVVEYAVDGMGHHLFRKSSTETGF